MKWGGLSIKNSRCRRQLRIQRRPRDCRFHHRISSSTFAAAANETPQPPPPFLVHRKRVTTAAVSEEAYASLTGVCMCACVCCSRRRGVAAQQLPRTGTAVRCRRKQNEDYARPIHVMCSTTRGTSHIKAFSEITEFIIVRVCHSISYAPKTVRKKKINKKTPRSQCRSYTARFTAAAVATKTNVVRARTVNGRPR